MEMAWTGGVIEGNRTLKSREIELSVEGQVSQQEVVKTDRLIRGPRQSQEEADTPQRRNYSSAAPRSAESPIENRSTFITSWLCGGAGRDSPKMMF